MSIWKPAVRTWPDTHTHTHTNENGNCGFYVKCQGGAILKKFHTQNITYGK